MPRDDLDAFDLGASDWTIHICPLCVYNLNRLPIHCVWRYTYDITKETMAAQSVSNGSG